MIALQIEKGASPHTLNAYGRDLQEFFSYMGWDTEPAASVLSAVDPPAIRNYLGHLLRKGLARRSIARKLAALRSFYRFCMRRGVIDRSPLVGISTPRQPRTLPYYLQQDQINGLLEAPPTDTPLGLRDRALLELLYATGIRLAEVVGLDLPQVELPDVQARGLDAVGRLLVFGKGGRERFVPLGSHAATALNAYLQHGRPVLLRRRGAAAAATEQAVFLSRLGHRISRRGIDYVIKKYVRQAGVNQRVTPHSFRHTFATHLLEGGADLRSVQEMLGHANVSSTQIYTHVTLERMRVAYKNAHPRA